MSGKSRHSVRNATAHGGLCALELEVEAGRARSIHRVAGNPDGQLCVRSQTGVERRIPIRWFSSTARRVFTLVAKRGSQTEGADLSNILTAAER